MTKGVLISTTEQLPESDAFMPSKSFKFFCEIGLDDIPECPYNTKNIYCFTENDKAFSVISAQDFSSITEKR